MQRTQTNSINWFWTSLILFFTAQMLLIVWPYTSGDLEIDFLLSKHSIIHKLHYQFAFYLHIFSSCIVLFCGAFLFSKSILKTRPTFHKYLGRIYAYLLLLIAAPSGLLMAFYANGGWSARISFILLSLIWWYTTYRGTKEAMAKNFKAHQKWMIRSYALTLSAVTLRIMQLSLGYFGNLDPILQYQIVSWLSWPFNLFVAEWIIRRNSFHIGAPSKGDPWRVLSRLM